MISLLAFNYSNNYSNLSELIRIDENLNESIKVEQFICIVSNKPINQYFVLKSNHLYFMEWLMFSMMNIIQTALL